MSRAASLPSEFSHFTLQGTRGDKEGLDKRYYKRDPREAARVLRVGTVFAVLRHAEYTADVLGQLKWRAKTAQGEDVFSHIYRMAVVKECHGFVWAIPINPYKGKGVGKPGFNSDDVDAHAIIYMEGRKPRRVAGEPDMKKTPIKVVPTGQEFLEAASRINFSKPVSVEHNVKFLNEGKIAEESMPYFTTYWRQHLG